MGGIRDRRKRQQEAIDSGEPLRTKKGRKKKGEKKGFRPNSLRHIGEKTGKAIINPANCGFLFDNQLAKDMTKLEITILIRKDNIFS